MINKEQDKLYIAITESNVEKVEHYLKYRKKLQINKVVGKNSYLDYAISYRNLTIIRLILQRGAIMTAKLMPHFNNFNTEIIKLLLEFTDELEVRNTDGNTYLHLAVKQNYVDIAILLIEKGADVNAKTLLQQTVLQLAFCRKNDKMITYLLCCNIDVAARDNQDDTPLHYATYNGNMNYIKCIVEKGADINASNNNGWTPLHLAISRKNIQLVQFLIESGADVNAKTKDNRVPLNFATSYKSIAMVELLLQNGALVNNQPDFTTTPLHTAVYIRNLAMVQLLVEANADVNAIGQKDETPLNIAIGFDLVYIAKYLIAHGAVVTYGKDRNTLLHMAVFNESIEAVQLLLKNNADVCEMYMGGKTVLHLAAGMKCSKIVEMIIAMGADVNAKDASGCRPLHVCAEQGHSQICQVLLKNGANVNVEDNLGKTPLYIAAEKGFVAILTLILQSKFDLSKNKLAINYAVKGSSKNHMTIVLDLISYGFSIDLLKTNNPEIDTCMEDAVSNGHTGIVEYALKNGYNVNTLSPKAGQNKNFRSLLHLAVTNKRLQNARLLIKFGSKLNIVDEFSQPPIFYAVKNRDFDMTKLLFDNKAVLDSACYKILFMAVSKGDFNITQEILKYHKNVNVEDESGRTALHYAVWNGDEETVQFLLEKGAKCNNIDQTCIVNVNYEMMLGLPLQTTSLHIAARKGYSDIAEAILEFGCDVDCRDGYGRTPLHIAALFDNLGVIEVLLEFNANMHVADQDGLTCINYVCNNHRVYKDLNMDCYFTCMPQLQPGTNTFKNCRSASELLVRNLAIKGLPDGMSSSQLLKCCENSKLLYKNCLSEMELFKDRKIINNITLYDVLTKSTHTLTSYLINPNFIKKLFDSMMQEKCIFYEKILKKRIRRAKERRLLLDEAELYFTDMLGLLEPPTHKIMTFLNNKDLRCVKQTYELIYSK